MIFFSMLILGALIGFVGAGGAGVVITLLTVGFDVPIHTASHSRRWSSRCFRAPSATSARARSS